MKTVLSTMGVVAALAIASQTVGATIPSAESILADVQSHGARAACNRLASDELVFDAVCNRIESGESEWLRVAVALRPGSDAAIALSLRYSVARALPQAPSRVLALIGKGFELEDVCTSPYIEPEPGVAEEYEKRALVALSSVSEPALKQLAESCARHVRLPKGES